MKEMRLKNTSRLDLQKEGGFFSSSHGSADFVLNFLLAQLPDGSTNGNAL